MDWTALADECRAEFVQHAVDLQKNPPESLRVSSVIGCVRVILDEADRFRNLVGLVVDAHVNAEL
jgi:hypothetical protein